VKVLILLAVLKRKVGGFLRGGYGGTEVLELACEAHAHFEGVCHDDDVLLRRPL
jgi:hypothetical protein